MKYFFLVVFFFGLGYAQGQTFELTDSVFSVGDKLVRKIYFSYNKADILPESKPFLDSMALFLKKFPQLQIEIATHTDYRGNDVYNNKLSQRRAQCIFDYLKWKGVDVSKMIPVGYGETNPVIKKEVIDKLPTLEEKEAAHSTNRRSEFIIRKILK